MRQPAIMGNWKMNKDLSSATGFIEEFLKLAPDVRGAIDIVIFPPFPLIRPVVEAVRQGARWSDLIEVGAQDMHPGERGAYTGAVSGLCLKSVGATRVIIGHSERRWLFGDDDGIINAKLKTALAFTIRPVLCVGEPLEVRDDGKQEEFVLDQLDGAYEGVDLDSAAAVTIAYEPVWAIGTGRNATLAEIVPMMALMRDWADRAGIPGGGESLTLLYGGSVNQENASELYSGDGVDGFLVGGASLEAFSFTAILEIMAEEQR
jgi:triosephosphate isomerase